MYYVLLIDRINNFAKWMPLPSRSDLKNIKDLAKDAFSEETELLEELTNLCATLEKIVEVRGERKYGWIGVFWTQPRIVEVLLPPPTVNP